MDGRSFRRWPAWAFPCIALIYIAFSELGMHLRLPPSDIATFWPAAGVGASAAMWTRREQWRWLFVALFVGSFLGVARFEPVLTNLGYSIANCVESFLFALVIQTWHQRWRSVRTNTAAAVPAVFVVGTLACAIGGVIGSAVTVATYGGDFFHTLRVWAAADLAGIALVTPIAADVFVHVRVSRQARLEFALAALSLVFVTSILLLGSTGGRLPYVHYFVLPPLIWIAIRVNPKHTAWAAGSFGLVLMLATATGRGPWSGNGAVSDSQVFAAQVFLVSVVLTAMTVARSTEDRRRSAVRQLETERALAERELEVASLAAERERQALEAQLLHSQRLEALGRLAGGVAHDFNNLLGVIRNYASLVVRNPDITTEVRADAEHIEHAASRGAELTRELLLFSRGDPEGGGTADAAAVARTVVRMLSRSLGATIDLRLASAGRTLTSISPARLEQALINLVINARDAISGAGLIDIVVSGTSETITVAVADTGAGMPPEVVARVFEPFFTTKGPGEGSGLGLSTVYGIVERAGGRVRVDSTPGRGTTVTLELLAAGSDTDEPARVSVVAEDGVVAVVDDDRELLALTVRLLEAEGIDAVGFSDGEALLAATSRAGTAPRLLVTDVVMPGLTGPQLAQEMWARFPGLPVIFVSGYAPPDSIDLDDPRATFLAKPFDARHLGAAIRARCRLGDPATSSSVGAAR